MIKPLTALTLFALLLLPAGGQAGSPGPTYTVSDGPNGKLLIAAGDGNDDLGTFYGSETGPGRFQISPNDLTETIVETSTHCTPSAPFPDRIVYCDYDVSQFNLKLGPGNDKYFPFPETSDEPWPATVKLVENGGPGNDVLRGAEGDDAIKGSTGFDKLIGKDGSDKINAKDGEKDRSINCGGGDDPKPRIDPEDPRPKHC
jgi:Ca2+-binding RTX toxin-like protein